MPNDEFAILGWGSLLWEGGRDFDNFHEPWQFDGPSLKIEFSRISARRQGALTLVIDPEHGTAVTVAYCLNRRPVIDLTIGDLRKREETPKNNIGYVLRNGGKRCRDKESLETISAWAASKNLVGVVWTDLSSNFAEKVAKPFSIVNALEHLDKLTPEAKEKADEYIRNAPDFVKTPLRAAWSSQMTIDKNY